MPPRKQRIHINKAWFLLLELLGLGLSFYLYLVSVGIVNIPCPRDSIFACTGVVRGTFGHFGPFSVAAMGVVYFLSHLMLTTGLRERSAQVLKGLLVLGGLLFIAWLRGLELIYIREICPWCWGVALVTLIHAGVTYTIVAPPLPKLKAGGIAGIVFGGFIVLIGLVSVVELSLGVGKKLQQAEEAKQAASQSSGRESTVPVAQPDDDKTDGKKSAPAPSPTPRRTPAPTRTPDIQVGDVPPTPAIMPSPTPSPTPPPTPAPEPELTFDPEPQLEDSEEVRILRKRGWRHAGSGASVVKAVKVQPPVLMLAYDPHCSDCHRLITQVLDRDPMNGLRVTRIAVQESMLSGQINSMVKALPTLILFGEDGSVLMTHVGSRIDTKGLVQKINQALGD